MLTIAVPAGVDCTHPTRDILEACASVVQATESLNANYFAYWAFGINLAVVVAMLWTAWATRCAAKSAGLAAKAALESNILATKTAELELRAYVFVEEIKFRRRERAPEQPKDTTGEITVRWKNWGKTPANNVRVTVHASASIDSERPNHSSEPYSYQIGPMAPGEDIWDNFEIDGIDEGQAANLRHIFETTKGSKSIQIAGEIHYEDVFRVARQTRFHSYIDGETGWSTNLHTHRDGNSYT